MGPPASGKRTIAKMVCGKLRTAHLTPDNLVTEAETDLKVQAQAFIEKNQVLRISSYSSLARSHNYVLQNIFKHSLSCLTYKYYD